MANYRVRVQGVKVIEASSPEEAKRVAVWRSSLMDVYAEVLGESVEQALDAESATLGMKATTA